MKAATKQAYEWAISQKHRSVAADYARQLAEYIRDVGDIEAEYPNWDGKFPDVASAVKYHTSAQNAIVANVRARAEAAEKELAELQQNRHINLLWLRKVAGIFGDILGSREIDLGEVMAASERCCEILEAYEAAAAIKKGEEGQDG